MGPMIGKVAIMKVENSNFNNMIDEVHFGPRMLKVNYFVDAQYIYAKNLSLYKSGTNFYRVCGSAISIESSIFKPHIYIDNF